MLKSHGLYDEVEHLLDNVGWSDLLQMNEPSYPQLVLEFLSTVQHHSIEGFTFRIANINHKVSNEKMADMFGWGNAIATVPVLFAIPFWRELTQRPDILYLASKATSSQIVRPAYRYVHKVLNHTIHGRGESLGGVSKEVLKILYAMHHGIKMDFTSLLAKRFADITKQTEGSIVIGGFITRIAEKIGAFDWKKTNLVAVEGGKLVDENTCLQMGLLKRVNGTVHLSTIAPHTNGAGTSHTNSEPLEQLGDSSTLSDIAMLKEQMSDLHFKLDAYFSFVGFTPPPQH